MGINILKSVVQKFFVIQFLLLGSIASCDKPRGMATLRTVDREAYNNQQNSKSPELILSAAASLQNVLEEIKQLYLTKHPQTNITFNFGSSGSLQHQIEQGAPIDLFISAAPQQMNNLAAKKLLLNETRQDLVQNQMVLVTSQNNKSIDSFNDLASNSTGQIALGEPNSVPAGKYAREILTNLDLIDDLKPRAVYGKDVRQVLNYVATGNIEAGIVYRSDLATAKKIKMVATAPPATHSPVVYPVAVIKDSNHPEAARQMLEFLFTPEAQEIFKRHGFAPIDN